MLVDRSIRRTLQVLRSLAKDVLHTFVISVPLVIDSVMQKTISGANTGRSDMAAGTLYSSVLWHCWLGGRKSICLVKSWVLVCWRWRFDWSFAHLTAPVVTTTSIIVSSSIVQNGDILVAYPGFVLEHGHWSRVVVIDVNDISLLAEMWHSVQELKNL